MLRVPLARWVGAAAVLGAVLGYGSYRRLRLRRAATDEPVVPGLPVGAAEPEDLAPGRPLEFDLAVVVRSAPREVYDLLAHKERHAVYPGSPVSALDRITPGPTRPGTRWVEEVPLLPGLRMTIRSQAERVEPGVSLEERFASPFFTGRLAYRFERLPEGTRLRQRQALRLRWPLRALARPIDAALRPRLLGRLAGIRDLLESLDQPEPLRAPDPVAPAG